MAVAMTPEPHYRFVGLRRLRRRLTFRAGLGLMIALGWCVDMFGPRAVRRTGNLLGELHYRLGVSKRRDLLRQLPRALGGDQPRDYDQQYRHDHQSPAIATALRRAYRANDRGVFEFMVMTGRGITRQRVCDECEIEGLDVLRAALAEGNGVILIGMHSCNGVFMTARLAAEGIPMTLVYRESNKIPDGLFERALAPHEVDGIEASDRGRAYRAMRRALRDGRVLCVLMDQASKRGGHEVDFLGKRLALPAGPPELVRRTRAPVLFARPLAAEPRWRFRMEAIEGVRADDDAQAIAERLARVIVEQVRRYPELWTWHHRRWRRYPFVDVSAPT